MQHRRISGFTLVELLVVIAIIGVLIALLLPAVQAAREAARRSQCQNNLKQIGVALHNFHSVRKKFPPGGMDYGWCQHPENGGTKTVRNGNGLRLLLPYLEQQALFDQFDPRAAAHNAVQGNNESFSPTSSLGKVIGDAVVSGNLALARHPISLFICPSDTGELFLEEEGAKTNYDFSVSQSFQCAAWDRAESDTRRMFGENSRTKAAMVTDGLSNTIAMAETLHDVYDGKATAWSYRIWVMVGLDLGKKEINFWNYPPNTRRSRLRSWGHAGSLHGDAVHVLMADGSTHSLQDSIDKVVLERLAAMADDQIVRLP